MSAENESSTKKTPYRDRVDCTEEENSYQRYKNRRRVRENNKKRYDKWECYKELDSLCCYGCGLFLAACVACWVVIVIGWINNGYIRLHNRPVYTPYTEYCKDGEQPHANKCEMSPLQVQWTKTVEDGISVYLQPRLLRPENVFNVLREKIANEILYTNLLAIYDECPFIWEQIELTKDVWGMPPISDYDFNYGRIGYKVKQNIPIKECHKVRIYCSDDCTEVCTKHIDNPPEEPIEEEQIVVE